MRKATQQRLPLSNKQIKLDSAKYESRIGIEFEDQLVNSRIGYLANVKPTSHEDQNGNEIAALLLYFIQENGQWFKALKVYEPYFFVQCHAEVIQEIVFYLNKTYEKQLKSVDILQKEDLELVNHLSGIRGKFIKLSFKNQQDLQEVKFELIPIIKKNKAQREIQEAYEDCQYMQNGNTNISYVSKILDIREYDVAYHIRAMIDNEIRCAYWYDVSLDGPLLLEMTHLKEKLDAADLKIFAFDIETTKAPLKFPDSKFDQIMMISYIIDGKGFLITNRQVVGDDVQDFEYSPKPEYDVGLFKVFNEPNEEQLLVKFFDHIRETKPFIFTTFNGDYFDWPFIQDRAEIYNLKIEEQIGVYNANNGEMLGRFAAHLDCFYWVKRDAYLPQGSHGLKAVTKAKLGYDPVELDPELMLPYAQEKPQELAEYSVSDAVATYFLYKRMIHDFIFALCTIIPTYPDEVLRRGSGTLCENLLMAQAFRGNIIFPNKQIEEFERFHNGKLIDTDTYIGGTVECLQQGVYRSDIPIKFKLAKEGYQRLIDETDDIMKFAIQIESSCSVDDVINYEEIKCQVINQLENLRDQCPFVESEPLIYHVDVAAMYPNIILSNRLQPVAIVNDQICAGCVFNKEENRCKKNLEWQWRGEMFPLSRKEFEQVKNQLEYDEGTQAANNRNKQQGYHQVNTQTLTFNEKLKLRVKKYCQAVYKQIHVKKQDLRSDTVCMRENSFYVDTVRDFRDRRYEYKHMTKVWTGKFKEAQSQGNHAQIETAKNRMNLFESLQLAHKIILNSFYGYVMKKGARWYSMEMAAMVTHTGGNIITDSRMLFDQIGMPLELDTDGIWACLPKTFPENFQFKTKSGKKLNFDFPCTMCNNLVYEKYGNNQYQTLIDKERQEYEIRHEMSVFFEIDGPYRCMLIPASKEENKMLKKRYAVFDHAGKMKEVKGFELKRRGELKIIKIFQEEVFSKFLEGRTLQECYDACGEVAERWYDILDSKGEYVDDVDLIEYIGEERVLSKGIHEYGAKKGTSITCAKRLAEFLGDEILKDDGGLNVKFIISRNPFDAKVAERAVPTAILEAKTPIKEKYLKKWLKDYNMKGEDFNIRNIIDWEYYKERLGSSIQKIVTIPAALQKCMNPIPKIEYPDWLHKRIKAHDDKYKQKDLKHFFAVAPKSTLDIEDLQKMGVLNPKKAQEIVQKKIDNETNLKSKEKYSKISECPDPLFNENFGEWMKYQKHNWRTIRQEFKDNKKNWQSSLLSMERNIPNDNKRGLHAFMKNNDEIILNSIWHIVSIEPTFDVGVMRLWAFTESSHMFAIKLNIPRIIYINSRVQSDNKDFRKVLNKILPRNRVVHNLYEWETSEEQYQDRFQSISYNYLLNNNVEGIYETKMPLKFRAVFELGCMIRPWKNKIPVHEQAQGRTYSIKELEVIQQNSQYSNCHYLPADKFDKIFLFHHSSNQRHVLGYFQQFQKICHVAIVNPAGKKSEANSELALLKQAFSHMLEEKQVTEEFESWVINESFSTNDLISAWKYIDKLFFDYKQKNKHATLVIFQSDIAPERLHFTQFIGSKTMMSEFPVIRYPLDQNDLKFPSLQWIGFAFKNILEYFIQGEAWLKERINFSRYAITPIGNLEEDAALSVIDTLYARNLSLNRHILWYSNTNVPDLGGHEDQDFRSYFQEEIENPEFIQKGFYRGYSVEIDLKNLAVNTILQSEFLKEFEEASMIAAQGAAYNDSKTKNGKNQPQNVVSASEFDTDLDEFVTCSAAFKKLKDLVQKWLEDCINNDTYADKLISNVYRWLTSPKISKLYDPLLQRLVHKLMTKNFQLLLRRFKQLGCKVIYASFHKIFIYSEKRSFAEAESQINFVLENIKRNNLFSFLNMQPAEYWRILLFKDRYNYGGIKETQTEKVCSRWDIINHLPEITQKAFRVLVGEFILKVYKKNLDLNKKSLSKDQQIQINQDQFADKQPTGLNAQAVDKKIESFMDTVDDVKKEIDHEYVSKLITHYFSQKLFREVSDFQMKKTQEEIYADEVVSDNEEDLDEENNYGYEDQHEEYFEEDIPNANEGHRNKNQIDNRNNALVLQRINREKARKQKELKKWEFPQKIGSCHAYISPALEFSKFITTHIFGLDEAFHLEANQVKINLLRMIHCKEFSSEAQNGLEPSLILVVPDVICEVCQSCSDLDICRDPSLNEVYTLNAEHQSFLTQENAVRGNWACQFCGHELNKINIERRLLDLVNRRLISYQMQDLKCKQCKMIKNTIVSKYCECTGVFLQTIGDKQPEKLRNQNLINQMTCIKTFMSLLRNFANFHQLDVLRDQINQILQVLV